jgi:EAL domain-containing protein (putative c-di-GMP-specific phosphodiesterase class I)
VEVALEKKDIRWYWQPKVHLPSRRVVGFEALARWTHARHGIISPDVFISAIEESKYLWPFTLATADGVIEQLSALPAEFQHLGVSINISARVLQHDRFVDALLDRLRAAQVDPRRMTLELTETALISNPVQAKEMLDRLANHGVGLSIDDFGAGFTSFGYLRDFNVGEIKLDRAYVTHLNERLFDQSLMSCLAVFCRSLGLQFVAEGIEDDACWKMALQLGCEYGQGYGIARPMPYEKVAAWLSEWTGWGNAGDLSARG